MTNREPGLSVRAKLTLSYAGFLMVAAILVLGVVAVYLLRYVPDGAIIADRFVPNRSDLIEAFAPKFALVLLFILVFGLVGGWILSGRVLAPMARITQATRLAATGALSHRIHLPGRQDEFAELADSFDTMLSQVEAHVEEQRRFAANASHELRTPLAITRTLLDVAKQDSERDVDELIARLGTVNSRAINLTEALLILSRADHRSFTPEPVDLSLIVEEAAETLLGLAEKHKITIDTFGTVATTMGSKALLAQMVSNLLQNAIVHNLPTEGVVCVTTLANSRSAILTVENTGDVLSADKIATLTEPFHRLKERIQSDDTGVGLGLAIVSSIVRAHDGTLTLQPRAGGGLIVTVHLPIAGTSISDKSSWA